MAEADAAGIRRIEGGRTRDEVVDELCLIAERDPQVVVGLDFSFSFPSWFVEMHGCTSGPEIWAVTAAEGEGWLAQPQPPFWGRPGTSRPRHQEAFRLTEQRLRGAGLRPSSTFQVGGAGAVGTASIRGMPALTRLRAAGFSLWPFDPPRTPCVVEVWPRLALGPVVKADARARAGHAHTHDLPPEAAASSDALDAAVAALWLRTWEPAAPPPMALVEGWVAGS